MLENVFYRGHDITIVYDEDGSYYGIGKGLMVYVDGVLRGHSVKLGALNVKLK